MIRFPFKIGAYALNTFPSNIRISILFFATFLLHSTVVINMVAAQEEKGFAVTVKPQVTGEEINRQEDLWVMEVRYKPMRLRWVNVTDPKTKEVKKELIWYLVYRIVNRPIPPRGGDPNTDPINDDDLPPSRPYFVPEFTLITSDNGKQTVYPDEIIPEAQAAIIVRERLPLKNSVEIISEIPQLTPEDAAQENYVDGVAIWRDVDRSTDFFSVIMEGFSNAYKKGAGPNGEEITLRRAIVQQYWRPGDEFLADEKEIRFKGKPQWIYRPDTTASGGVPPVDEEDGNRPEPVDTTR